MATAFTVLQLVLGFMFYTLIGMAALALLLRERRTQNNIYLVMAKVTWLPRALAAFFVPRVQQAWLARVIAVVVVLVSSFFLLNYVVRSFTYWGAQAYALPAYPLLVLLLVGAALTVPKPWLWSFTRGLLALGLVEAIHLTLYAIFRSQGWLPALAPATA